ncbi:MAG TPA: vWA domain-containing protein [Nannocystaceae bacterium]|nr:vWA domain-containing protein [Nannocystaceae bacterium]
MVVSSLALCGCPADLTGNGPPQDPSATDVSTTLGTSTDTGSSSDSGSGSTSGSTETGVADSTSSSTGPEGPSNCGELPCAGHSSCALDSMGVPTCFCDDGYVLADDDVTCEIDQGCIQVRPLEDNCRQLVNDVPAVGVFFAVDFCAGPAVTPALKDELGLDFKVLENGTDIEENVESYFTIVDKPVESYVTLVVDVSGSVILSGDLPALVEELRTFVAALTPTGDEPDVYVSVYVFARNVAEYVPFTRDLGSVDDALASFAADPDPIVELAGNANGTALYQAVEVGINRTQRIRELRDAVTWGGVLSTGTVVVVTDGNDQSGGDLNNALIDSTVNNVVSIGISDAIVNEDLQAIGRDASILAPEPADWAAAFEEIATRVDEYPERSYLLAYCSSTTEGTQNVEVTVDGIGVHTAIGAECAFDADVFSSDPGAICDGLWFSTECSAGGGCGGLTACGACADDECCAENICRAPMNADDAAITCIGQPELCEASDEVCDLVPDEANGYQWCVAPAMYNDETCDPACDPGVTYCGFGDIGGLECINVLAPGAECGSPDQCPEQNCSRVDPDNLLSSRVCRERALLHDYCGNNEAKCEQGGYCTANECQPKLKPIETCSQDYNCRTGECVNFGMAGNRCDYANVCFWAWDEKAPT